VGPGDFARPPASPVPAAGRRRRAGNGRCFWRVVILALGLWRRDSDAAPPPLPEISNYTIPFSNVTRWFGIRTLWASDWSPRPSIKWSSREFVASAAKVSIPKSHITGWRGRDYCILRFVGKEHSKTPAGRQPELVSQAPSPGRAVGALLDGKALWSAISTHEKYFSMRGAALT